MAITDTVPYLSTIRQGSRKKTRCNLKCQRGYLPYRTVASKHCPTACVLTGINLLINFISLYLSHAINIKSKKHNSMQHSPSWETSSRSADHQIFRPLWKPQDHYCVHVAFSSFPVTMDSQLRQFDAKFKSFGGRFRRHLEKHAPFCTVFNPLCTELRPLANESSLRPTPLLL